ncbi:MAG: B12-binding domain-containing radical SAM protein, partial [Brevefilum sp.]
MPIAKEGLQLRVERILPTVTKPGRYVGGELNQVVKPWDSVQTHVALVFPDIYDLGQSNLGMALLYDLLNQHADVAAERAFSPWVDMEAAMRAADIPLFSLENKRSLADFEIIGVSLPYETLYTNFLNILDLADIPLYSAERGAHHPLVIAGGQAVFNPEPVAPFVDAFAIGEGEEVIFEIVAAHQAWVESGQSRQALLVRMAGITGVYVPALVDVDYRPDGRISSVRPAHPAVTLPVKKRILAKLPPPLSRFL